MEEGISSIGRHERNGKKRERKEGKIDVVLQEGHTHKVYRCWWKYT